MSEIYPKHPIVSDFQEYCNQENTIRLCRAPTHVGEQMNERVDQARNATENQVTLIPLCVKNAIAREL